MSSTPSPATDDSSSEGDLLREFVDEALAKERQAQTSMSPRSAVLSHSSLRSAPQSDPLSNLSNGSIDPGGQLRKRSKGKRRQRDSEVARPSVLSQLLDVDISRKDPTEEVLRLRQILKTVEKHAVSEARRARDLQRANHEAQQRLLELRENKLISDREAEKAKQEIRLFQYQLQNAEQEIARSQAAVKSVERQRDDAEDAARRAREKARKLREGHLVLAAREEGRRLGYEAGFEQARIEREIIAARRKARSRVAPAPAPSVRVDKGKRRQMDYPGDEEQPSRPNPETNQQSPRRFADDIESSPDSPSGLPLKSLLYEQPPSRPQSQDTSFHTFRPPSDSIPPQQHPPPAQPPPSQLPQYPPGQPYPQAFQPASVEPLQPRQRFTPQPPPAPPQQQQPPPQHRPPSRPQSVAPGGRSPSVLVWPVDLPPASQIPDYNSNLFPQKIVNSMPRDQWVTAQKHRELTSTPPHFPGGQPPALLPHPPRTKQATTPTKGVRFPFRPSLKQTKAYSWYRSLSQRRKNKRDIDPVPEEDVEGPSSAEPPVTTSTVNQSEPPSATEPPTTGGSVGLYAQPQDNSSWYQAKQPLGPSAPSVKSTDYAYNTGRRRPISEMDKMSTVSTRVSQFDLLATPEFGTQSVPNGKEGKKVKEKESYLSAIRENPLSRETTPNADRYLAGEGIPALRSSIASIPQPNFGQPSLHQQPLYATMQSQNTRRPRRPPSINPPEPDDVLPPPGLAYDRQLSNQSTAGSAFSGRQGYPDLSRRPSRISEKTTPDTSYQIDVVPPSGAVPDFVQSPPHTGVNHLSPYHIYRPSGAATSTPRVAPMQSVTSLRSQGGSRLQPPAMQSVTSLHSQGGSRLQVPGDRPPSVAPSRKKSRQSFHVVNSGPDDQVSPPPPRPSSRHSRAASASAMSPSGQYSSKPPPQLYSPRPERPASIKSSASRKPRPEAQPLQRIASQASVSPNAPSPNPPSPNAQAGPSAASGLVLEPPMHHRKSTTSLRSTYSYSKYNPDGYVDPAFWGANGPDDAPPAVVRSSRASMRAASVHSGLSYA